MNANGKGKKMCEELATAVLVPTAKAQAVRQILEKQNSLDGRYRLRHTGDGYVAIPITRGHSANLRTMLAELTGGSSDSFQIVEIKLPLLKKSFLRTPFQLLTQCLEALLDESKLVLSDELWKEVPDHWERHGDLVLLPSSSFQHATWNQLGIKLWEAVADGLSCQRLARKDCIAADVFRCPQVTLLLGDDGWVEHVDNRIRYSYDVLKCMYSVGNVTEKLRIASFNCRNETVVDLYAGIGYFTLPFLVHAAASVVHACEWNPDAVEALQRNLKLNRVEDRCVVHFGDNRQVCPRGIADRVNLGLIPSSRDGWQVACAALKANKGGMLHIHGNVSSKPVENFIAEGCSRLSDVNLTQGYSSVTYPMTSGVPSNMYGELYSNLHVDKDVDASLGCLDNLPSDLNPSYSLHTKMNNGCGITRFEEMNSSTRTYKVWEAWAHEVSAQICSILQSYHGNCWRTEVKHIEHVKSYAPHVDHLVVDLLCQPASVCL